MKHRTPSVVLALLILGTAACAANEEKQKETADNQKQSPLSYKEK